MALTGNKKLMTYIYCVYARWQRGENYLDFLFDVPQMRPVNEKWRRRTDSGHDRPRWRKNYVNITSAASSMVWHYDQIEKWCCTRDKGYIAQPLQADEWAHMELIVAVAPKWHSVPLLQLQLYCHPDCLKNYITRSSNRWRSPQKGYDAQRLCVMDWDGEAYNRVKRRVCNEYKLQQAGDAGKCMSTDVCIDERLCQPMPFGLEGTTNFGYNPR